MVFGDPNGAESVAGWETFRPAEVSVIVAPPNTPDATTETALAVGAQAADAAVDSGADLVIPVLAATSAETQVAAIAATTVLVATEPAWVLGFDRRAAPSPTATDTWHLTDAEWMARCHQVRDLAWRARHLRAEPLLEELDEPGFAALVGALAQLAERKTPVLLDGGIAAAAALTTARIHPLARETWYAPQRHGDALERHALDALALDPMASLGIRCGHGVGALALVPLLQAALVV